MGAPCGGLKYFLWTVEETEQIINRKRISMLMKQNAWKKWIGLPQLSNPISHFSFILNDVKRNESVNLRSTIPLWTPTAIKLCPKILISKHLPCETEHLLLWTKHYFETQYIFFNFCLFWMIFMVMGTSSAVPYTSLNSNAPNRDPH